MKLIFFSLLFVIQTQAQIVTIPDVNFKNKLLSHNPVIDTNSNSEIEVSEAQAVTFPLNVSVAVPPIVDLTGIEAFINIEEFNCAGNLIETLDLSANPFLWNLDCSYNAITSINLTQNIFLRIFSGSENLFTTLDITANPDLEFLQSNFGELSSLDVSQNINLQFLYVQGNNLTELDLTHNPLLEGVILDNNDLSQIDLSQNSNLYFFYGRANLFSTLDVSNNPQLIALDIKGNNDLTYLNLKNGNNDNLNISGVGQTCNFEELPLLETVCLDDVNSLVATFIEAQCGHAVSFTETCLLSLADFIPWEVTLYPNPTNDIITIQATTTIAEMQLFDLLGNLVLEQKANNPISQLSISGLNSGIFILKIRDIHNNIQAYKIFKN
ncbi:MAG: T9SS type A sorting domain-containing protein [Flavobacteriaceae bacterium]